MFPQPSRLVGTYHEADHSHPSCTANQPRLKSSPMWFDGVNMTSTPRGPTSSSPSSLVTPPRLLQIKEFHIVSHLYVLSTTFTMLGDIQGLVKSELKGKFLVPCFRTVLGLIVKAIHRVVAEVSELELGRFDCHHGETPLLSFLGPCAHFHSQGPMRHWQREDRHHLFSMPTRPMVSALGCVILPTGWSLALFGTSQKFWHTTGVLGVGMFSHVFAHQFQLVPWQTTKKDKKEEPTVP